VNIRQMQDELFQSMNQAIDEIARSSEQKRIIKPGSKAIYREAQSMKWQAKRVARMAYAIEVLESIEPRYGNWSE